MKTLGNSTNIINIFRNLGLVVLLSLFANTSHGQQTNRTVSGIVKSNDGPLFGASIVLKGTSVGVASNKDGSFTFPEQLDPNSILVISYLGYENAEVKINSTTRFIQPFLEDIPVVILGALRTQVSHNTPQQKRK